MWLLVCACLCVLQQKQCRTPTVGKGSFGRLRHFCFHLPSSRCLPEVLVPWWSSRPSMIPAWILDANSHASGRVGSRIWRVKSAQLDSDPRQREGRVTTNRCCCQITLSAAELWRSQLYHELSRCLLFILVTLPGFSSSHPRIRFTPRLRVLLIPPPGSLIHLFTGFLSIATLSPPDLPTTSFYSLKPFYFNETAVSLTAFFSIMLNCSTELPLWFCP